MGDAAFGMTGLDFETAARAGVPIITVVLNNATWLSKQKQWQLLTSYSVLEIGWNYADMARAMGGYPERIEDPSE
ncbi:MAG: hypothetical protein Ct9H300mP27_06340 [Chloroflexota bacterium]|nr:MAG: hypothetical protein Ct9H300mP27_06340 [Chloroflexota bacterium]